MARITTHIARMPPNVSAATTGGKARVPGCQSVHNAAGGWRLAASVKAADGLYPVHAVKWARRVS